MTETKKYNTLDKVVSKLSKFAETHDYDDDFDKFDELCDKIMSDNQTYFQWEVDGDCFDLADAFDTVLECIKEAQAKGKIIKDYNYDFIFGDDRLFVFVEYQ